VRIIGNINYFLSGLIVSIVTGDAIKYYPHRRDWNFLGGGGFC